MCESLGNLVVGLCKIAFFVVISSDLVFSLPHIGTIGVIAQIIFHLHDTRSSGSGSLFRRLVGESVDVAHLQFGRIRHGFDKSHIILEFAPLCIDTLQVFRRHLRFLAGRRIGNHTLVSGDSLVGFAQILLHQRQVKHSLACFRHFGILFAQRPVLCGSLGGFAHSFVGACYFKHCRRRLGAFGIFGNQLFHLLYFSRIVLLPSRHHRLIKH